MGSADGFRNSGQTQILAWEGTLFVTNGENDVFAIDVDTGEILWRHRGAPDGGEIINGGQIFTPFWTRPIALKPGTMGGANWPPSSYDRNTGLLYVCASDRISAFRVNEDLEQPGPNQVYMGGRFTQAQADDRGIFAALDVRSNRIAWRQQWREICYSGSVMTAGGVVFVGRSDGRLTALDSRNGRLLWEFMTDAGVNTTVTTFEHEGEQRVVVHAERGAEIYAQVCVACHGPAGDGGHGGGPSLIDGLDAATIEGVSATVLNTMPGFGAIYSAQSLRDVTSYVLERLAER